MLKDAAVALAGGLESPQLDVGEGHGDDADADESEHVLPDVPRCAVVDALLTQVRVTRVSVRV